MTFVLRLVHSSKRRTLLFALALLGVGIPASVSAVKVHVRGNGALSDREIRRAVSGVDLQPANEDQILRRVQESYIEGGYLFATIQAEWLSLDSSLVLVVDEGEAARYGEVTISGASEFEEAKVSRLLGAVPGNRFKPGLLNKGIESLLEAYDGSGYPFAQVWMDSLELRPESRTVDVSLYVVEGGSMKLQRVEVEGLQKTRKEVAVKLSGLEEGERYSGDKVREAYLRLKTSGIFDDVAYPTIRVSPGPDGVEALIQVVESERNHSFSAAFGYADREGTEDQVISGVVRLDLVNIGGSLRDMNIFWSNDGAERRETKLAFRQRFLVGKPLSFGLALEQIGLDTLYTWQSLGVEVGGHVGRLWGGLLGIEAAARGDRNTFSVGDVSKSLRGRVFGGFSYVRGREERGSFFELRNRYALARKRMDLRQGGGQTVSQHIFELGARFGASLAGNLHFSTEVKASSLESPERLIPLSEQYYIGGAATLRGYRENQFHGRRVAYIRNELLFGKSRKENAYLFGDLGHVLEEAQGAEGEINRVDVFKFGHGFGLRTQSRAGNIDVSFAIGDTFSLRQTKVHIILNRTF